MCIFFYFKKRQRYMNIGGEKSSIHCFTCQISTVSRTRPTQDRSLELNLSLPLLWQERKYLSHHPLPPRAKIIKKLNQKGSSRQGLNQHFVMRCRHLRRLFSTLYHNAHANLGNMNNCSLLD